MQTYRSYVAEVLGTFLLTLAVSVSIVTPSVIPTPAIAGLTLMVLVYIIGPISGAHVNPAVTIGMWCIRKISTVDTLCYVLSQALGASLVAPFLGIIQVIAPQGGSLEGLSVGIGEALGAGILVLGVSAVASGKASGGPSGVTVGGSLFLGATVASVISSGIVNPAVAIGIGAGGLTNLLAPLIGGVLAAETYRWMAKMK
jgi:glycerol uptake facilitator-like aquaporin